MKKYDLKEKYGLEHTDKNQHRFWIRIENKYRFGIRSETRVKWGKQGQIWKKKRNQDRFGIRRNQFPFFTGTGPFALLV